MTIAFLDVDYQEDEARAACVLAHAWTDAAPSAEHVALVPSSAAYRPGAFFERELPCLLAVLAQVKPPPELVVVDGYVVLDAQGTPGLGAHLHERIAVPVVGVAKTAFRGSDFAEKVLRGTSRRPLFVTARGIEVDDAAAKVKAMHGAHRIPSLGRRSSIGATPAIQSPRALLPQYRTRSPPRYRVRIDSLGTPTPPD